MSLFQAREWWSTQCGDNEEFDGNAFCVGNCDNSTDRTDKIIAGSLNGILRIYQPKKREFTPDDLMCEQNLLAPVLQVECGRFVPASDRIAICVLHPQSVVVYTVQTQRSCSSLEKVYEHELMRTGCNFCYGPFGNVFDRDFICVQSIDGMLSIFEQDVHGFDCFLPGFLLPGPLCYIAKLDSFVTFNSSLEVEIFKFQTLALASREDGGAVSSSQGGRRMQRDWATNIGEQVLSIDVARFSRSLSTVQQDILVLADRGLFCLKETGAIRLQKRMEYSPSCCHPYTIDSGTGNQNLIVGTHACSLQVYKDMQLIWAARVPTVPVAVSVASFGGIDGFVVWLNDTGHITVSYMGTDPSSLTHSKESTKLDYKEMEVEMSRLHKRIKELTTSAAAESKTVTKKQKEKLTIDVCEPIIKDSDSGLGIDSDEYEYVDDKAKYLTDDYGEGSPRHDGGGGEKPFPSVILPIKLTSTDAQVIIDTTVQVESPAPFMFKPTILRLPSIPSGECVESKFILSAKGSLVPSNVEINAVVSYSITSNPHTSYSKFRVPLVTYASVTQPVRNSRYKLTIITNRSPVAVNDIFPEMVERANKAHTATAASLLTMRLNSGDDITVIVSRSGGRYRVQSDSFAAMWSVLSELLYRLEARFNDDGQVEKFTASYEDKLPLAEFYEAMDAHHGARIKIRDISSRQESLAEQFRSVQKRLLVRYRDKNPRPLVGLDKLLEATVSEILILADERKQLQASLVKSGSILSASTRLLTRLIALKFGLGAEDIQYLEAHFSPNVIDCVGDSKCPEKGQGWEELTDIAISHLLRTALAQGVKDQMNVAPPPSLLPDTTVLKKRIAVLCDRMSKGMKLRGGSDGSFGAGRVGEGDDE